MSSTDAKGTAKQEAGQLADSTKQEARAVADEAQAQVRNVLDDARTMVGDQSRGQRDRLVDTSRTLGHDLEEMAENGPDGLAKDVARQLASQAKALGERLDGREPEDILDDVRRFARQRPGTFLLGALAAGVVVGRMTRSARDAKSSGPSGGELTSSGTGTGTGSDLTSSQMLPPPPPAPEAPRPPAQSAPYGDDQTTAYSSGAPQTEQGIGTSSDPVRGGDPLSDPLSDPLGDPHGRRTQ